MDRANAWLLLQVSPLKRSLRNPSLMLGDGVSQAFLRALVGLIGGYREALSLQLGESITFQPDRFLQSRPPNLRAFLEKMLQLQIFHQAITLLTFLSCLALERPMLLTSGEYALLLSIIWKTAFAQQLHLPAM